MGSEARSPLEQIDAQIARLRIELVAHLQQRLAGETTSENWALLDELITVLVLRDILAERKAGGE